MMFTRAFVIFIILATAVTLKPVKALKFKTGGLRRTVTRISRLFRHHLILEREAAKSNFEEKYKAQALPSHMNAKLDDFDVLEKIGEGGQAVVYKVEKKSDKIIYAMKTFIVTDENRAEVHNEQMLLYAVDSKYLSKLHYCFEENDTTYLVMTYVNGIELNKYVEQNSPLSEENVRLYAAVILLGLDYLHNLGCTHHDLKPENILIDAVTRHCVIIDLGSAKVMFDNSDKRCGNCSGSPLTMAPELWNNKPHSNLIDCWSFGVVLYVMIFNKYPFNGIGDAEIWTSIMKGTVIFPEHIPVSKKYKDLSENLLTADLKKRYSIKKTKADLWFKPCFKKSKKGSNPTPSQQKVMNDTNSPDISTPEKWKPISGTPLHPLTVN